MTEHLHYIKKMREAEGLSQEFLGKELGVSRPTMVQIEKGERELTVSEAQKLAKIFGISLEDFLKGREPKEPTVHLIPAKKRGSAPKQEIRISVPQNKVKKFKEVLLYVLEKIGAKPNIGEGAVYKILYFIDFNYYEKYEEQLIGATYIKNHYGPTPIEFAKIVAEMQNAGEIEKVETKYFKYDQKKYLPRRPPNKKYLTGEEIEVIDEVINKLGDKSVTYVSNYSHQDVPWLTAEEGKPIDYEAVFYRTPEYSVRSYDDQLPGDRRI